MPRVDLVYNSDLYALTNAKGDDNMSEKVMDNCSCTCPTVGYPWASTIPVPPPMPNVDAKCPPPMPPMPPWPYPPYPPYPVPPCPPPFPPIDPDTDKGSTSQQICKLSRKANIITKMIENLETKKKDVIITIGGVSYNFGNVNLDLGEGWPDGSYAATVKKILEYELGLIKTKIAELAEELGEEADSLTGGIEGTVGP